MCKRAPQEKHGHIEAMLQPSPCTKKTTSPAQTSCHHAPHPHPTLSGLSSDHPPPPPPKKKQQEVQRLVGEMETPTNKPRQKAKNLRNKMAGRDTNIDSKWSSYPAPACWINCSASVASALAAFHRQRPTFGLPPKRLEPTQKFAGWPWVWEPILEPILVGVHWGYGLLTHGQLFGGVGAVWGVSPLSKWSGVVWLSGAAFMRVLLVETKPQRKRTVGQTTRKTHYATDLRNPPQISGGICYLKGQCTE